jgi:hypothetical protein
MTKTLFTYFDRVRDVTTTTGTGVITVSGTAPQTYRTFSSVFVIGNILPVWVQHQTANEWEVGWYTYSAANQLTRTVTKDGTNATSPVNFSSGTKDVVCGFLTSLIPEIIMRNQRSVTSGPVSINATDSIVNLNCASPTTVNLPAASGRNGASLTFKDVGGLAAANNITITRAGSDLIDGATTFVMTNNRQMITLNPFNDGVNAGWFLG